MLSCVVLCWVGLDSRSSFSGLWRMVGWLVFVCVCVLGLWSVLCEDVLCIFVSGFFWCVCLLWNASVVVMRCITLDRLGEYSDMLWLVSSMHSVLYYFIVLLYQTVRDILLVGQIL